MLGKGVGKGTSQGFLALEKRILASLEARKARREQCKREKIKDTFRTSETIVGESLDMPRARVGFGRRMGSSGKESGPNMQMTEVV
jgi:hypothetical protein